MTELHLPLFGAELWPLRAAIVTPRFYLCLLVAWAIFLGCNVASAQQAGDPKPWVAPSAQAQKKNPIPANESSLAAGRKIYFKTCVSCHGKAGNGDGNDAIDLGLHPAKFSDPKLRAEPDGALYWKISTGRKPMPDYGNRLSPTDRWNVINFLRTLTRGGGNG